MSFDVITRQIEEYEIKEEQDLTLEKKNIEKVKHILSQSEIKTTLKQFNDPEYITQINYADLVDLYDKIKIIQEVITEAKDEIDIDEFFKRGEIFDFKKLRKDFKERNLHKRYPKFNFDRYEELAKNPPLQLTNYKGETIEYDKFFARKLIIAVNQMIFDEMDLYLANVGTEGAGKSCWSSQVLLFLYYFLTEVGLIEYEFDVTKLFFSSLRTLIEQMDTQEDNDYFRLMALDEAYELNRSNYRDDNSKLFKDDMRSSRKMQRIILLNLPQLGELELAIIQTRLNFIFYCKMDNDVDTGRVKKGIVDFYILPRGSKIYSPRQRREIPKSEIINSISAVMKDKNDSYKGLPTNCLVETFHFKGVWGFDKEKYDKHIKKENRKRRTEGDFKISNYILYLLFMYSPELKHWGKIDKSDKTDKKAYYSLQKLMKSIKIKFIENPELEKNMERRLKDE